MLSSEEAERLGATLRLIKTRPPDSGQAQQYWLSGRENYLDAFIHVSPRTQAILWLQVTFRGYVVEYDGARDALRTGRSGETSIEGLGNPASKLVQHRTQLESDLVQSAAQILSACTEWHAQQAAQLLDAIAD